MKDKKILLGVGLVAIGLVTTLKSSSEKITIEETKATNGGNIPFKTLGFATIILGTYLILKK